MPCRYPELEWDFRLKNVVSINASGHKYGEPMEKKSELGGKRRLTVRKEHGPFPAFRHLLKHATETLGSRMPIVKDEAGRPKQGTEEPHQP